MKSLSLRARPKLKKITVVFDQAFKKESYMMWSQLTALDVSIDELDERAGVAKGEWDGIDASLIQRVPGVVSVHLKEVADVLPLKRAG